MSKEILLVRGGTTSDLSNRANGLVDDLELVSESEYVYFEDKLIKCESPEDLIVWFDELIDNNINLVGSRGYVYMTEKIKGCFLEDIRIINLHESLTHFLAYNTIYTRNIGLRFKVGEILVNLHRQLDEL